MPDISIRPISEGSSPTSQTDTESPSRRPTKRKTINSEERTFASLQEGNETVQTQKPFTTLSAIGIGYGVTNTAVGIPLILTTALPMGGSPMLFWGFILQAVIGLATAMTLAELVSAMPHPGGQYVWTHRLAPERYRRSLSYAVAMMSWIAPVATSGSAGLSVPTNAFAIVSLLRPSFPYRRWMGFVAYQLVNILTCFGACFLHALPRISKATLIFNAATVGAVIITLFAMSDDRTTAGDFIKYVNISGWSNGVAFLIGSNGPNWCFSCLDVVVHLAEEIPSPAKNLPKALMWTIAVGFVSGLLMVLAIVITFRPMDAADFTGVAVFSRITGSNAATLGLWVPLLVNVFVALWAVQTWQSRTMWTVGRESGFPLHRRFSKIYQAPFRTPIWSLIGSAVGTALFGCLYLASETAFNSLISAGILLQYVSYSIPTLLVLRHGRSRFQHGEFWYPRLGFLANIVMLAWTATAIVFYSFPIYAEVVAGEMNYVSVVLALCEIFILSLWFLYARNHYQVVER